MAVHASGLLEGDGSLVASEAIVFVVIDVFDTAGVHMTID
jgi:hypothetical protein